MDNVFKSYSKLDNLNVSRETFLDLEYFLNMILEENKKINILSRKNLENIEIRERHIIDSAQTIDFVDLNGKNITDIGSGGGMPGVVIAIILKNMKNDLKINLFEKSYHKSRFLREISRKLKLNIEVFQKNIFEVKKIQSGTIMSRAFKPMPIVLDLVHKNFYSFNNLILFMGQNGKKILKNSLKDWDLEYIEKKSITNKDSFLLNIKKIKKKN